MTDLLDTTIGALCTAGHAQLQTGPFGSQLHSYDYVSDGVPVVPTEAIRARRIDLSVCPRIADEKAHELERHRLRSEDILFARRGVQATGHIGVVRKSEEGFICGTGAIRLRVVPGNPLVDAEYLSHVLADPKSVAWFKFHAIGATMPNLNEGIIRSFPLILPAVSYQREVARLFSSLDDKIELNWQMNETLEAMAQAIFRDWFVDFGPVRRKMAGVTDPVEIIGGVTTGPLQAAELSGLFPEALGDNELPQGWALASLSDIVVNVVERCEPSPATEARPYVPIDMITARSLILHGTRPGAEAQSSLVTFRENDILFGAMRPYFHKVALAGFEGTTRTTVFVLRPRLAADLAFALMIVNDAATIEYATSHSSGTTIPYAMWRNGMDGMPVVAPPPVLRARFGELVSPMLDRMKASSAQSQTLAETRDYLLPRLMSGEVRVGEASAPVEDAA